MGDKDGCDYNHWRQGDKTYFGVGSQFAVDTSKPMTVVTQFHTDDGTDNGELVEIRRLYVQDGRVIENSITQWDGMGDWDSITQEMCDEQKVVFDDPDDHAKKGGQCPGGHLDVCISLCPTQPADLFQNCVNQCMEDCS